MDFGLQFFGIITGTFLNFIRRPFKGVGKFWSYYLTDSVKFYEKVVTHGYFCSFFKATLVTRTKGKLMFLLTTMLVKKLRQQTFAIGI